jgi:hypothetical protein
MKPSFKVRNSTSSTTKHKSYSESSFVVYYNSRTPLDDINAYGINYSCTTEIISHGYVERIITDASGNSVETTTITGSIFDVVADASIGVPYTINNQSWLSLDFNCPSYASILNNYNGATQAFMKVRSSCPTLVETYIIPFEFNVTTEVIDTNISINYNSFEDIEYAPPLPSCSNYTVYPTGYVNTAGVEFGKSVKISDDGKVMAVGAPIDNNGDGALYIYRLTNGTWVQEARFSGEVGSNGNMGQVVDISPNGNTVVAMSPNYMVYGELRGRFDIYMYDGTWQQVAGMPSGVAGTGFGTSVSLLNDKFVAGLPAINTVAFDDGITSLTPSDTSTGPSAFGVSVSISANGNVLAVGDNVDDGYTGAVWIFRLINGVWTEEAKLVASNSASSQQGKYVSLSNDGTVLGVGGISSSWVWRYTGGTWVEEQILVPQNTPGLESLNDISISGNGNRITLSGKTRRTGKLLIWNYAQGVWNDDKILTGDNTYAISVSLTQTGSMLAIGSLALNPQNEATGKVEITTCLT